MEHKRLVLALMSDVVDEVMERWRATFTPQYKHLDTEARHTQIVDDVSILRWDWILLSQREILDLTSVLEQMEAPYELIIIGQKGLDDVERWQSHYIRQLPIHLECHVTVTAVDNDPSKHPGIAIDKRKKGT